MANIVPDVASSLQMTEPGSIPSEKSWKFTARKKGEFDYTCTFHPTMKAILHVE